MNGRIHTVNLGTIGSEGVNAHLEVFKTKYVEDSNELGLFRARIGARIDLLHQPSECS